MAITRTGHLPNRCLERSFCNWRSSFGTISRGILVALGSLAAVLTRSPNFSTKGILIKIFQSLETGGGVYYSHEKLRYSSPA